MCKFISFLLIFLSMTVLFAAMGGPDGFGYMWADEDEDIVSFNWLAPDTATAARAIFPGDDDESVAILIPFPITYYDTTYSDSILVTTNGVAGFDATLIEAYINVAIPFYEAPNAAMYLYWDDLMAYDGSRVYYHTVGTTPNRTFVITWFNWFRRTYSSDPEDPLFFQLQIHEASAPASNVIEFHYLDPTLSSILYSNGASATIGIEDRYGTDGLQYSFNTASLDSGRVIRFWRGESSMHDCGVLSILRPTGDILAGAFTEVVAVIRNFGTADEPIVPVFLNIVHESGDTVFNASETTAIDSGALDTVVFTGWIPTEGGVYNIFCHVEVTGDTVTFNDRATSTVTAWPHISRGGPDGMGYLWFDSYDPQGPAYVAPPVASADRIDDITGDDAWGIVDLPFTFTYYEEDFDEIVVSTNGWISFDASLTSSYLLNDTIPSSSLPNALLAVYWDDSDCDISAEPSAGIMQFYDVSTSSFWIIWNRIQLPYSVTTSPITYAARLFMDGTIEYHYLEAGSEDPDHTYGASATVGIENLDGTDGLLYQYNGRPMGNPLFDHFAIRFVPPWTGEDTLGPVINHTPIDSIYADVPGFCFQFEAQIRDYNMVEEAFMVVHYPVSETRPPDTTIGDIFKFTICGLQPGDTVGYHFTASDTLGNSSVSSNFKIFVNNPHQGGPDIIGYHFVDSWAEWDSFAPEANWIELNPDSGGAGTAITFGFSGLSGKIGFSEFVPFYGILSGGVIISNKGWAIMDTSLAGALVPIPPTDFPNPAVPNAVIAPLWTNLESDYAGHTGGGVYYHDYLVDAIGASCFIIQWDMFETATSPTDLLRFQAKIYYDSHLFGSRIEFVYRSVEGFARGEAAICIEHESGYDGLAYMYRGVPEGAPIPTSGSAVLFYQPDLHNVAETELPKDFAISAFPNPFNATVAIEVSVTAPDTRLEIFDINGRRVKSFDNVANGKLLWNGEDIGGNPMGSGVYFARLTCADKEITTRLVLIK